MPCFACYVSNVASDVSDHSSRFRVRIRTCSSFVQRLQLLIAADRLVDTVGFGWTFTAHHSDVGKHCQPCCRPICDWVPVTWHIGCIGIWDVSSVAGTTVAMACC